MVASRADDVQHKANSEAVNAAGADAIFLARNQIGQDIWCIYEKI